MSFARAGALDQWTAQRALSIAGLLIALATPVRGADPIVSRVIDGDTIELEGGEVVRLIGVDTPETKHPQKPVERFGREATAFTKRLALGKQVRLEGDRSGDSVDKYGRTLAYVYLPDGRLLNLEIIRQGYGHAYTKYPFGRMEEFRAAEREARQAGRGLWGDGEGVVEDDGGVEAGVAQAAADSCIPRSQCCKVCRKGKACGDSCISASYTCRKDPGCACNAHEVCR